MKKALCLEDGRIAHLEPASGIGDPFPVAPPLVWRDCSDTTTIDFLYVNGTFVAPTIPIPETPDEREIDCLGFLNGGTDRIDLRKVIKAHVISCEAFRLGKLPGQLTGSELIAIRNRVSAIYKSL